MVSEIEPNAQRLRWGLLGLMVVTSIGAGYACHSTPAATTPGPDAGTTSAEPLPETPTQVGTLPALRVGPVFFACGADLCLEWGEQESPQVPLRILRARFDPGQGAFGETQTRLESTVRASGKVKLAGQNASGEPVWRFSGLNTERWPEVFGLWTPGQAAPVPYLECASGSEGSSTFAVDHRGVGWAFEWPPCSTDINGCTWGQVYAARVPANGEGGPARHSCLFPRGDNSGSVLPHPDRNLLLQAKYDSSQLRLFRLDDELQLTEIAQTDLPPSNGLQQWAFLPVQQEGEKVSFLYKEQTGLIGDIKFTISEFTYDGVQLTRRVSPVDPYILSIDDVRSTPFGATVVGFARPPAIGYRVILLGDDGLKVVDGFPEGLWPPQVVSYAGILHAFWIQWDEVAGVHRAYGRRLMPSP